MIAYEIQLQYVILDKIQSETKSEHYFFLDNFFSNKIFFCQKNVFVEEKIFFENFSLKKNLVEKNSPIFSWTEFCFRHCLGFPVHFLSYLGQIDAYIHTAIFIFVIEIVTYKW